MKSPPPGVERGVIWGIRVHSVHKREVTFFFSAYNIEGYKEFWNKDPNVQKGP